MILCYALLLRACQPNDPFFYHPRARCHPVRPQALSGSGGRFLVPTGRSATYRCHCSVLSQSGDRRAFSGWFSWEGKSGSPRRGCVDKEHWSPGHAALKQRLASLNSRKEGGGLVVVDHRGQGRRGEGRGQGRSWTVGVSMGTVNARPARGSAVWTSPRPGLA